MDLNGNLADSFFTLTLVALTGSTEVSDRHGLTQLLSPWKELLSLEYFWLQKMSEKIK